MVAIHELAAQHEVDLDSLLRDRFRVCQLCELSAGQASKLIGELKAMDTPVGGNLNTRTD